MKSFQAQQTVHYSVFHPAEKQLRSLEYNFKHLVVYCPFGSEQGLSLLFLHKIPSQM